MGITVSFGGNWDGAIENLATLQEQVTEQMMPAMEQAVGLLRETMAEYPEQAEYHLMGPLAGGFYSERQRRFFFAALREGAITVPYIRTGELAASWTESVEQIGEGKIVGTVKTDSPIAGLVMGEGTQARMFVGIWTTAQERFNGVRDEIVNILRENANAIMERVFKT